MSAPARSVENTPTIIEAAITPYRPGEPLQDSDAMVANAIECFAAGAGIVHHHHDFRQERNAAIAQMIDVESRILAEVPTALMYGDYLKAKAVTDKMAHLQPMADAGMLRMLAIDPGHTMFCGNDSLGRPIRAGVGGTTYGEAHELIEFAKVVGVPISLGVYEPGQLRWIMAYERAVGYPAQGWRLLTAIRRPTISSPGAIRSRSSPRPRAVAVTRTFATGSGNSTRSACSTGSGSTRWRCATTGANMPISGGQCIAQPLPRWEHSSGRTSRAAASTGRRRGIAALAEWTCR